MQNRQFKGGTGDDGANCSETLMGDGERHGGIKPFPVVRNNPKMRKKEFLNIGRVESGDFLLSRRYGREFFPQIHAVFRKTYTDCHRF